MNKDQLYLGDDGEFTVDVILSGEQSETVKSPLQSMPHEHRRTNGKSKPKSVPKPGEKRAGDSIEVLVKMAIVLMLFLMVLFGVVLNEQDGPYQPVVVPVDLPAAVPTVLPCWRPPAHECVVPSAYNTYSQDSCQLVALDDGRLRVSDGCRLYSFTESGMRFCLEVQQCLADQE